MAKAKEKSGQAKPKTQKLTEKQYEELGRHLVAIYETGYLDTGKSLKSSFLKGVFQGFGGVIGATVLVALLLWALTFFSEIPLLGHFLDKVHDAVETSQQP